jgi:hypothetical protein
MDFFTQASASLAVKNRDFNSKNHPKLKNLF